MTAALIRILVVEDRPEDRELIEYELTRAKVRFESRVVETREDFLRELRDFHPDVVLSDFSLPQFDALEALAILRRHEPQIPFVLVTGAHSEEVAVECMKRGADDYIMKSTLKRLPSAVVNALNKRAVERQMAHTEESLRERDLQYRTIAEHTRDLIFILDKHGQFAYASPSFRRALGYDPSELVGKKAFSLLHPEDKESVRMAFRRAQESGNDHASQFRYRHKDGSWRLFESVVSWVTNEPGDRNRAVVVARDIEERRALEEQVRQAQKMEAVGRLAGGVAHDFNNLLTAINGYSDLLLRSLDRMDPRRADVEEIKETAARAAALTQQLLAFSRRQITTPTVIDINHVVGNLEKMLRRLIGEDIQLKSLQGPDLFRVRADMAQLEQVIINLSVNARDAMPEGGMLTLESGNVIVEPGAPDAEVPPGSYVRLSVTDTGCGMDHAVIGHLFEPFFTTKEKGRGTGLGLSTVYGIVQQAGGHIRVTTAPGQGTSFRIYLPRVDDRLSESERSTETDEFFKGNERILLVEDDRAVRTLAARVLRQSGYQVSEATSGEDAWRMAKEPEFAMDILVTDVVMNGMNGPALARKIMEHRPHGRVLYLSGYMESDARNSILKEAESSFLAKPFRPRDLVQKVREILDGLHSKGPGPSP